MEPQVTKKEVVIIVMLILSVCLVMVVTIYEVRNYMKSPPPLEVFIISALVIGFCLIYLGAFVIDRFRRGGHARHALERVKKGDEQDRIDAVTDLHGTGKKSAFYIESIRREGGLLGNIQIAESRRILDLYVLPGLAAALLDKSPVVRLYAQQALEDIGTFEALVILDKTLRMG